MYGKKAIYFNYKSYGAFIALILAPALLILLGGSLSVAFLSLYPLIAAILIALAMASPGIPRLMAINANIKLREGKYKKALKKARRASHMPLAPLSIHIFTAFTMVLTGDFPGAKEKLELIKSREASFSEKSKIESIKALIEWKETGSPEKALTLLGDLIRKGADEAVYYTTGKLLNLCDDPSKARKYNEEAYEMNPGNMDIAQNLVISYCLTGQKIEAKLYFRNLYYEQGANVDSLYYMAKIKQDDGKSGEAADFIRKAMDMESSALNIINHDELAAFLNELERENL
ncbi:MAG: hypothetical protein JXB33_04330 [Clostridia bacterium]|nr:hypothetical protein [Clostridia bacterium]